jgi:polysaccharide deacetylase family protein (PEP-CTERM system associated)
MMKQLASCTAKDAAVAPGHEAGSLGRGDTLNNQRPPLILTFDVEDWNQLVQRRLGLEDWDRPGPALPRQMHAILDMLDEMSVKATFFLLGMTAGRYPRLTAEIPQRGHEIACHGNAHRPVYTQSAAEFRGDLEVACDVIGRITGRSPAGYRAPVFSINRDTIWAYDILAELGFRYDASQYDSPRIPNRIRGIPVAPYQLRLPSGRTLWEFPIAVARTGPIAFPVGGGSYWRLLPAPVVLRALRSLAARDRYPTLYLHPYELDPEPLRVTLPPARSLRQLGLSTQRRIWRNSVRRRVPTLVRAVAAQFTLVSCEQASVDLAGVGARRRSLSKEGTLV